MKITRASIFLIILCTTSYLFPLVPEASSDEPTILTSKLLNEPDRVIRHGDLMKITLRFPGQAVGSLEKVQKNGAILTRDGIPVQAAGFTLAAFRTNYTTLYAKAPGYEEMQIEVHIASSPYFVIRVNPDRKRKSVEESVSVHTNISGALSSKANLLSPTIYPRNFKAPLTIWQAIQLEGGIPHEVDVRHIRILKSTTDRKTLDCSGANGTPDGGAFVESGDYIFLVPDNVPVSQIFE